MTRSDLDALRQEMGLDRLAFNRLLDLPGRSLPSCVSVGLAKDATRLSHLYRRWRAGLEAQLRTRPVWTGRDASLLLGITDTYLTTLHRRGALPRTTAPFDNTLYATEDLLRLFDEGTYHSPLQQSFLDWLEKHPLRRQAVVV